LTEPQTCYVRPDAAVPVGSPVTVGYAAEVITAVEIGLKFTLNGW
jgi:hypothetical protein